MTVPYQAIFEQMYLVLKSKCEEFQMYEYEDVTVEQLWLFCIEKKWRKKQVEDIRPHELVATIFSITTAEFMQYTQVKQYHYQDTLIEISVDELDLLMGRNHE